jgi:hypothetical protein
MDGTSGVQLSVYLIGHFGIGPIEPSKPPQPPKHYIMKPRTLFFLLLSAGCLCLLTLMGMYHLSERTVQRKNPFIRRFAPELVDYLKDTGLKYNSYYFAGYGEGIIYLGNHTAPLHVIAMDTSLISSKQIRISLTDTMPFKNLQLRVTSPYFYLMDGSIPCVFSGKTADWKAMLKTKDVPYFTQVEPVDSISFAFRGNRTDTGANVLGTFKIATPPRSHLAYGLLQQQPDGDGIFDTDGLLLYNTELKRMVYTYRYRNQFVIADQSAKLVLRGNTIDTTNRAHLKVVQHGGFRKMGAPPMSVNVLSATYNNLLFVNSALRGKFDSKKAWQSASTIDVYDIQSSNYIFSFYIAGINGKKMTDFIVTQEHVFCLIGSQLVAYTINNNLKKELLKIHDTINPHEKQYTGLYQGEDRKPVKKSRS